jgi:uroporphyrinogen decarboxylase
MTPREHIRSMMAGQPVSGPGFWIGKPHPDTLKKFETILATGDLDEIQAILGDDVRWITPQHDAACYRHPEGKSMRPWRDINPHGLSAQGLLSDATSLDDLERIEFPDAQYLDFGATLARLDVAGPHYRLGGMWAPFFHDLSYLFGTEELLCLMLEEPELVHAACARICEFYLAANERLYAIAADRIDAHFFGNDFGTQNGLLISPDAFREFFLPWVRRFADQAKAHGLACILHCCGGIADIVDDLIAAGVTGIHPLQTAARGMEPEGLAERFGRRVTFWGGVDSQHLLQDGSPPQVREEVARLDRLFGHRIVIGPSHEALLPSVNLTNVLEIPRALGRWEPPAAALASSQPKTIIP